MSSDGGYANAGPYDNQPGMSVRDEFAKALLSSCFCQAALTCKSLSGTAVRLYDFAQALTDEKLRRDQVDRDEKAANG